MPPNADPDPIPLGRVDAREGKATLETLVADGGALRRAVEGAARLAAGRGGGTP